MSKITDFAWVKSPHPVKIFAVDANTAVVQSGDNMQPIRVLRTWLVTPDNNLPPAVRKKDPDTSHWSAEELDKQHKRETYHFKLLGGYISNGEGNFWQIGRAAGLNPKDNVWKRCSELREKGYIRRVVRNGREISSMGEEGKRCMVCEITDFGRAKYNAMCRQFVQMEQS